MSDRGPDGTIPLEEARHHERNQKKGSGKNGAAGEPPDELCLAAADWLARDIPTPDFLCGEWLSTTSRIMLVAPTGLGKTNLCLVIAASIAAGRDFFHWRGYRKARVLYIDGEMSRRLMKQRLADTLRRLDEIPEGLFVLCRDDVESMPPLNTPEGQAFIDSIIRKLGGVDVIIFDNVQALLIGDMKDEDSWHQILPWLRDLTKRSIGQLWIHHTGLDETHSYGTKTREWGLDSVILLQRIEGDDADIAFDLSFTKSRERSPANRADFESRRIRLADDCWTCELINKQKARKPPSPKGQAFHRALLDALAMERAIRRPESANRPSVTMAQWKWECMRLGVIDRSAKENVQSALLSKYRLELIASGWAACNGDFIWDTANG
jgi:hypothetical protein